MENITALVGQMGWPIASAVLVMWFAYQLVVRGEQERREEREAHRKEVEAMTAAINNNTLVLQSLKERLEKE